MSKAEDLANLAELVSVGYAIRDAAADIGLSENAAYKISATTEFKAKVHTLRTEKTEAIAAQGLGAASDAIRELQVLATTAEKDSDRIAACKAILSQILPLAEQTEIRRRLDDIERIAEENREAREEPSFVE